MSTRLDRQPGASLDRIRRALEPLDQRFASAGHTLFLVGGILRDLALGLEITGDLDLTTDAMPEDTLRIVREVTTSIWSQGERFGTIGLKFAGFDVEITTFRSEAYDPDSRKPIVTFGHDLHTDLSRRDFTINAMAASLRDAELIDPFEGIADLGARTLRTPIDPDESFTDDPLRLLRAARFIARFALDPTPELTAAATRHASRIKIVSAERIRDEFERLLHVDAPLPGLRFLADHNLLSALLPVATILSGEQADERELVSTLTRVSEAAGPHRQLVRRAAFFAPLGPDSAHRALSALRYPRSSIVDTVRVIDLATRMTEAAGNSSESPSPAEIRRLVTAAGPARPGLLDAAIDLACLFDPAVSRHRIALEQLRAREDLSTLDPPIDGRRIIEALSLPPGPAIGRIIAELRQHRVEHGPYDEAAALELLPLLAARLGLDPPTR